MKIQIENKFVRFGFLALVILANGFVLRKWVVNDERTLAWDQSIHTKVAYIYKDRLANEGVVSLLKPAYFNYPPLYHLSLIPVLGKIGDVADAGAFINFFYLSLLVISIYLIGVHLMGYWQGLTAAFLFTTYPLVFDLATQTMIDLSLTMWVAVGALCLIKSDYFTRPLWSIFFGIALGLGMLTKWTALAYLLAPLMVAVAISFRSTQKRWLIISASVAAMIMLPWYISNLIPMLSRIAKVSNLPTASGYAISGFANMFWYPLSLFEQIGFIAVLLFIPGIIAFFWQPKLKPLVFWVIGSLALFTMIHNRNTRYFMPALPAVALLSVSWIPNFRKIPFLVINLLLVVFFILFHFFPNTTAYLKTGVFPIPILSYRAPFAGSWKHDEIIEKIKGFIPSDQKSTYVLTVSNAAHLHSTTLNLSVKNKNVRGLYFEGPPKRRWFEFIDFILLKTGELGPEFTITTIKECANVIKNPPDWFFQVFVEDSRWPLPDGSEAVLYRKSPKGVGKISVGSLNISLDKLDIPNITAQGVEIKAVPIDNERTSQGILNELTIKCKTISYKTLDFHDISVHLVKPQINLPLFLETQDLQMLKLEKLRLNATISSDALVSYAAKKAKWLKTPRVLFQGKTISVSGKAGKIPLLIEFNLWIEKGFLHTRIARFRIAGVPFPKVLLTSFTDRDLSLMAGDDRPYDLEINSIYGEGEKLVIS